MKSERVERLLEAVAAGRTTPQAALERLRWLPVEPVNEAGGAECEVFARIDHHRALRQGHPEAVLCEGKTSEQVVRICERLAHNGDGFLATRADESTRVRLADAFPSADVNALGRTVHLRAEEPVEAETLGRVLIVSAGTGDLPVAEESASTATALGNRVERLYDVGVAGIHRLLGESTALAGAAVVIVVAGMDGALPSVAGGLVEVPVIAVPTSVGYGVSFGGLAALLTMLTGCAAGVTVVNIDNGFGAACAATRINRLAGRPT